jgi:hypothetical protein
MSKQAVNPRLWTIKQTASYWGVSPNTFRKMVEDGIAPGPIDTPGLGRLLFDKLAQDAAIDARSTIRAGQDAPSSDSTWDE